MRASLRSLTGGMALVAALLLLASCGIDPRQALLGTWQQPGSVETLEFRDDGTLILTTVPTLFSPGSQVLRYAVTDDHHLQILIPGLFGPMQVRWEIVSLSHTELVLQGPQIGRLALTRVR